MPAMSRATVTKTPISIKDVSPLPPVVLQVHFTLIPDPSPYVEHRPTMSAVKANDVCSCVHAASLLTDRVPPLHGSVGSCALKDTYAVSILPLLGSVSRNVTHCPDLATMVPWLPELQSGSTVVPGEGVGNAGVCWNKWAVIVAGAGAGLIRKRNAGIRTWRD